MGWFWAGFLIGSCVGAFVGIITIALLRAGAREDDFAAGRHEQYRVERERERHEKKDELSRLHL